MPRDETNFRFLNLDGRWPGFEIQGLERAGDGSLALAALPRLVEPLPGDLAAVARPVGPEGVAADGHGRVFFTHAADHSLWQIDPCDGAVRRVPCVGGAGEQPTQFRSPCGVALLPERRALVVVDQGNDRLQLFDVESLQLLDVWDDFGDRPASPRRLAAAAVGPGGETYVADAGADGEAEVGGLYRLNLDGVSLATFFENVRQSGALRRPVAVDVAPVGRQWLVFVLDAAAKRVFAFDREGRKLPDEVELGQAIEPLGLLVDGDAVYVGDNARRRMLKFDLATGHCVGEAYGYDGPIAALARNGDDGAWLSPGRGHRPLRLALRGDRAAYRRDGVLFRKVDEPVRIGDRAVEWGRLQADVRFDAAQAHVKFYLLASDCDNPPALDTRDHVQWFHEASDDPVASDKRWRAVPRDVADMFVAAKARNLWLTVHFQGDGTASPRLTQIKAWFDQAGYAEHLPAAYQQRAPDPRALDRFLALFESFFVDVEQAIGDADRYFDVDAAPEPWLVWLAEWLGVELDESWPAARQRAVLRQAYELSAWRGTAYGLRWALRLLADCDAHVQEPIVHAAWWALPDNAERAKACTASDALLLGLGASTRLAGSSPQGAVLGSTAVLDQSRLIVGDDYGAPLFADAAHQFIVQIYRSPGDERAKLATARRVIDREKPAHALYELCLIEPAMRVGYQSILGIDSVVGRRAVAPSRLNERPAGDALTVLAGPTAGELGGARVGQTTRLGGARAAAPSSSTRQRRPRGDRE